MGWWWALTWVYARDTVYTRLGSGLAMGRIMKAITFSLPQEMAERVDRLSRQRGQSESEFVREAVSRLVSEYEWRDLTKYGERKAREMGISPDDVAELVQEYRVEVGGGMR